MVGAECLLGPCLSWDCCPLVRRLLCIFTANGAFTAVSARRTFARPSPLEPAQPVQASAPSNGSTGTARNKWPGPVRSYVQRAFALDNVLPGVNRADMETKLKAIISTSASEETLDSIDWEHFPLPQQVIQKEREEATMLVPIPAIPAWNPSFSTSDVPNTNLISNNHTSKKRKSTEMEEPYAATQAVPPWRTTNDRNVFEARISYPDKRQRNDTPGKGSSKSQYHLENRKKRFENGQPGYLSPSTSMFAKTEDPVVETDEGPVVGRCQDLEKKYFRLTSAPNPLHVRPVEVLEKTLDLLKKKWRKEGNYSYICDQFKSLRQDLTVQHVKTEFTVNVYEIHARIALEKGDLGEYNQCQTQLRALYSQNLGGHPMEFKAYRILYFVHTCNRTDMNDVLADLTPAEKQDAAVKHALDARSALALGNYHRFFQLYLDTPNMGAYMMDMFVSRERLAALSNICKA